MSRSMILAIVMLTACGPEPGTPGTGSGSSTGSTGPSTDSSTSGPPPFSGDSTCSVCGPPTAPDGSTGGSGSESSSGTSSPTTDSSSDGMDSSSSGTEGLACSYDEAEGTCMCDGVWSTLCEECVDVLACQPPECFLGAGGCVCGEPGARSVAEGVFCGCSTDSGSCVCNGDPYPETFCDPWA